MFLAKKYRKHNLLYIFIAIELPLTIVILTFTGIASHDRYRTKLWQDGYDNGFNSSPNAALYAAANYRPYSAPMVWRSFTTQFNLVIAVLSTFILITKVPLHILHILYPIMSVIIHAGLVAVYAASATFQAGKDTSDPKHPQNGPPWYITKQCSVASNPGNIGYCQQAKSLFAFTVIIAVVYFIEVVIALHSCIPTKEERAEREEEREEKRTFKEYEDMILKSPSMIPMTPSAVPMSPRMAPMTPRMATMMTPATATYPRPAMPVMTPRSLAFNRIDSNLSSPSTDLPLRDNFGTSNPQPSVQQEVETISTGKQPQPQIYFPPPPKKALKK